MRNTSYNNFSNSYDNKNVNSSLATINNNNISLSSDTHNIVNSDSEKKETKKISEDNTSNSRGIFSSEQFFFDLFGFRLYFDDILIMGLLFFLFVEGVDDEMLYIALILLLLSYKLYLLSILLLYFLFQHIHMLVYALFLLLYLFLLLCLLS